MPDQPLARDPPSQPIRPVPGGYCARDTGVDRRGTMADNHLFAETARSHADRPGAGVEIESLAALDARLSQGRSLADCYVQSLDLSDRSDALLASDVTRAVFLGCTFAP